MAEDMAALAAEKRKTPLILTASLYALFFAYALSVTMIGPLIPVIMKRYAIDLSESGLITFVLGIGGLLAVVLGMIVSDLLKKSLLVKAAAFAYGLSLVAMSFAQSYAFFLVMYFFLGASTRLMDAVVNAYVSDIHTERRGFYMNLLHASFALGAVAAPPVTSALIGSGVSWNAVYLSLGIFCMAVSAFYYIVQTRVKNESRPVRTREAKQIARLLKDGRLLSLCAMSLLYTGLSAAYTTWMPSFMLNELKTGAFFASLPGSVYWAGILCGRLTFSFISEKLSTRTLLLANGVLAAFSIASAVIVNSPVYYLIALFLAGFLLSAIVPFAVALGCAWYPKNTGSVSSMIFFSATAGFMLLPWVYGIAADAASLYFSVAMTIAVPLLIALSAALLPSKRSARD